MNTLHAFGAIIVAHWPLVASVLTLAVVDFILGRTTKIKPNSTLDLVLHFVQRFARAAVRILLATPTGATIGAVVIEAAKEAAGGDVAPLPQEKVIVDASKQGGFASLPALALVLLVGAVLLMGGYAPARSPTLPLLALAVAITAVAVAASMRRGVRTGARIGSTSHRPVDALANRVARMPQPFQAAFLVVLLATGCGNIYTVAHATLSGVAVADKAAYLGVKVADRPLQEKIRAAAFDPCRCDPSPVDGHSGCVPAPLPACEAKAETGLAAFRAKRKAVLDALHELEDALDVAGKGVDEAQAKKLDVAPLVGPVMQLWSQTSTLLGDFGVKVPTVNAAAGVLLGGAP